MHLIGLILPSLDDPRQISEENPTHAIPFFPSPFVLPSYNQRRLFFFPLSRLFHITLSQYW